MSYLVVSGICVQGIAKDVSKLSDSSITDSRRSDLESSKNDNEKEIMSWKYDIARNEDYIKSIEASLGGRGESSTIRYY